MATGSNTHTHRLVERGKWIGASMFSSGWIGYYMNIDHIHLLSIGFKGELFSLLLPLSLSHSLYLFS